MQLKWKLNYFKELSTEELYNILQLRNEVFVVEQNCVYQDADSKDSISFHLSGWDGGNLVAYCRILPPGVSYTEASIGRVVSSPQYRNKGYGKIIVKHIIDHVISQKDCYKIILDCKQNLEPFYKSCGLEFSNSICMNMYL